MGIKIIDGTGHGYEALVDSENRLYTLSVALPPLLHSALEEDAWFLRTPIINLTSANPSGVFYLLGADPDKQLSVDRISISLGNSDSPGDTEVILYENPTGGTLVTAGTATTPRNRNLGSVKPANVTCLYGAEGSTIVGATELYGSILQDGSGITQFDPNIIMPSGAGLAITVTPPTGNTSMDIRITAALLYEPHES